MFENYNKYYILHHEAKNQLSAAKAEDEQDAGDEIEEGCEVR